MLFDDFHYVFVKEKFTAYFVISVSYTVVGPSPDPDKEQQFPFKVSLKSCSEVAETSLHIKSNFSLINNNIIIPINFYNNL